MPNKMLIDATHPEETRVVVVRGNRVEEFDFETAQRRQLRGNIYLAKVTRVEPSLQAAFIEYGGNRHGFLAFSEIHPDYYQIPVADRQALIEAEEQAHREAEEENENRSNHRRRSRHRNARRRGNGERIQSEIVEGAAAPQPPEGEATPEGNEMLPLEGGYLHAQAESHDAFSHDHGDQHDHEEHDHDGYGHDEHERDHRTDEPEQATHEAPVAEALAFLASEPAFATVEAAPATEPVAVTVEARRSEEPDTIASSEPVAEAEHPADEHDDAVQEVRYDEHQEERHDEHLDESHGEHHYEHQDEHHDEHLDHAFNEDDEESEEDAEEEVVESVGGDDVMEEVPERTFRPRRQYKIQEVIKRRQVMLVQVVKEERGNKGAALTTYLSLAGRYAVLMPNTARGGGISRKITSAQDRSRLKEVVQDLDVPEGMGIILRTAGASRTKPEIKRDFEYLLRLWETVRDTTLNSQAPTLVYEEGSLIKRSLRDLYNKEIDEILVAGEPGYREARDFMKMLMPSNIRAVKPYRDGQPLFSRMGVESQLDAMFSPTVQLRSGGYLVINQTEALVSIDVNSGRSTREHHIEDTALKTNLEAAEEVARQLRLRDLAGLIVIDFIDMDEKRNNRAVERKLSDCLRQDRARIQVGRISHFGLLEMSRQRIRASVLESSTEPCSQCGGTGHVRSVSSVALQLLRGLEEALMKGATHNLIVRTRTEVALYVLNHKRSHLRNLEDGFKVTLSIIADQSVSGLQSYVIERGDQVHTLEAAKALLAAASQMPAEEPIDEGDLFDIETESEIETEETEGLAADEASAKGDGQRRQRRRRRRGRGGARDNELREDAEPTLPEPAMIAIGQEETIAQEEEAETEQDESEEQSGAANADQQSGERRRRRGRRGGRRRRGSGLDDGLSGSITDELMPSSPPEAFEAVADFDGLSTEVSPPIAQTESAAQPPQDSMQQTTQESTQVYAQAEPAGPEPEAPQEPAEEKAKRRRSTVREKVSFPSSDVQPEPAAAVQQDSPEMPPPPDSAFTPTVEATPEPTSEGASPPRRAGWWSRRFGRGE